MLLLNGNGCLIESRSLFQATEPGYLKVRLPEPVLNLGGLRLPWTLPLVVFKIYYMNVLKNHFDFMP